MKKQNVFARQILVPAWNVVSLVRRGADLFVEVMDSGFGPMTFWQAMGLGQEDLLGDYYASQRRTRATSRSLPHLRFAGATDEGKLLQFVMDYGPLLARRQRLKLDWGHDRFVQNIAVLGAQQRLFAAILELVLAVNELDEFCRSWTQDPVEPDYHAPRSSPRISRSDLAKLRKVPQCLKILQNAIDEAVELSLAKKLDDEFGTAVDAVHQASTRGEVDNLSNSHRLLCQIFNLFPPKLYFGNGVVQEFPDSAVTGIRPVLYFLLREVYLMKHKILRCGREDCGQFFIPVHGNARFCKIECGNLVRQRALTQRRRAGEPIKVIR